MTKTVDRYTRAGSEGKTIYCPNCHQGWTAGHFSWAGFKCTHCKNTVDKQDWLLELPATRGIE